MHVVLVAVAVAVGLLVYKYTRSNENFYSKKKSRHRHLQHQSNHHTTNVVLVSTPSSQTPKKGHCYYPTLKVEDLKCNQWYGDIWKKIPAGRQYNKDKYKVKKLTLCTDKSDINRCYPCNIGDRQIKDNLTKGNWKGKWGKHCHNKFKKSTLVHRTFSGKQTRFQRRLQGPYQCNVKGRGMAFCVAPSS